MVLLDRCLASFLRELVRPFLHWVGLAPFLLRFLEVLPHLARLLGGISATLVLVFFGGSSRRIGKVDGTSRSVGVQIDSALEVDGITAGPTADPSRVVAHLVVIQPT